MTNNKNGDGKVKLLYAILSVVFAVALWAYVSYVQNDMVTGVKFNGIKINFTGEEIVNDHNLVITSIDVDTVNLVYSGRRNTLAQMTNADIIASVDLSGILDYSVTAGVYQLPVNVSYSSSISTSSLTITSYSNSTVTVTVENMITRTISVRPVYNGDVADGYMAEQPRASADTITVSGSQDVVYSIAYAQVTLERSNLSKSVSEQVEVKLIDSDGNEMSTDGLTLSADFLTVTVSILMVKEVPLEITPIYGNSATDENTTITISPPSVTLSGDPDILEGLNSIKLGTVDTTSFGLTYKDNFTIVVPDDVRNESGITSASVSIEVLNTSSKRLSADNITVRNTEEFTHSVNLITQTLDVTIRGSDADLELISSENIRIVADLSDMDKNATGTYVVQAKVYVDGYSAVDAVGAYTVTVTIV